MKPVVPVTDNSKLENNVTVKLHTALQSRYRRLSDELDEEFEIQNFLDQSKEDLTNQMDQLILLKAQFEMSFEDLEKKNKELGTEIFIYFTLLFFYNYFFISFNFNFVQLIFFLNYSCVFDNPWLDYISFFSMIILSFSPSIFCFFILLMCCSLFAIKKMITFTYL